MTIFFDGINAFPSMSWDHLDAATGLTVGSPDALLLWSRYHRAASAVADADGTCLVVRPQIGDKQGDGPAAERYILAQDPVLDRWCNETEDPPRAYCSGLLG